MTKRLSGFGFRISDLDFRVSGFRFRVVAFGPRILSLGVRVSSLGFQASRFAFWVSDLGFRVSGFGSWVSGFGFRVSAHRMPKGRRKQLMSPVLSGLQNRAPTLQNPKLETLSFDTRNHNNDWLLGVVFLGACQEPRSVCLPSSLSLPPDLSRSRALSVLHFRARSRWLSLFVSLSLSRFRSLSTHEVRTVPHAQTKGARNHRGGNPGANRKSISHRCYYLWEVAFEWGLTKETTYLPQGCLQGGPRGPRGRRTHGPSPAFCRASA